MIFLGSLCCFGRSNLNSRRNFTSTAEAKLTVGVCLYTLRYSFITEATTGGLS